MNKKQMKKVLAGFGVASLLAGAVATPGFAASSCSGKSGTDAPKQGQTGCSGMKKGCQCGCCGMMKEGKTGCGGMMKEGKTGCSGMKKEGQTGCSGMKKEMEPEKK